jgi:hypothetical protein
MLLLLYWGQIPRIDKPQSQTGCYGEEEKLSPLSGIERRFIGCPVCSSVTTPDHLFMLLTLWCNKKLTKIYVILKIHKHENINRMS